LWQVAADGSAQVGFTAHNRCRLCAHSTGTTIVIRGCSAPESLASRPSDRRAVVVAICRRATLQGTSATGADPSTRLCHAIGTQRSRKGVPRCLRHLLPRHPSNQVAQSAELCHIVSLCEAPWANRRSIPTEMGFRGWTPIACRRNADAQHREGRLRWHTVRASRVDRRPHVRVAHKLAEWSLEDGEFGRNAACSKIAAKPQHIHDRGRQRPCPCLCTSRPLQGQVARNGREGRARRFCHRHFAKCRHFPWEQCPCEPAAVERVLRSVWHKDFDLSPDRAVICIRYRIETRN